jgi:hypothetical protein
VVEDPTEHRGFDTHEAITTNDVEHILESDPTSRDERLATTEPAAEGEPKAGSTVEPIESNVSENHETDETPSPEQHETPEPTQAPEGTP